MGRNAMKTDKCWNRLPRDIVECLSWRFSRPDFIKPKATQSEFRDDPGLNTVELETS